VEDWRVVTITGVVDFNLFAMAAAVMVTIVAALHVYFLVLEMFLWRKPLGLRTFGMTQEAADSSAVLAANQGLYNGFLAAGLLWGLLAYGVVSGRAILTFFLACVIVAGLYGAATVSRRIALVQALPAAIALALVWLA
jgi:putative membrane protein